MADARRRARRATEGSTRVRRRADTPLSAAERRLLGAWPTQWAMTVRAASGVAPEHYEARVQAWARAIIEGLAAVLPPADAGAGVSKRNDG